MNCIVDFCNGKAVPHSELCRHHTNRISPLDRMLRKTKSLDSGCIEYTGTKTKDGVLRQISHKGKMYPASRFRWMLDHGRIKKGFVVCHKCDNPPCVNIDHLFLGTFKDNSQDASRKFRLTHGEDSHFHKLTETEVLQMRKLFSEGSWTYASLGRKYNVNESTSAKIIKGKSWKHLIRN